MNRLETIKEMFMRTFEEWREDNVPMLAAALSYYTALSVAPMLVVLITVVGVVLNSRSEARGFIVDQIQTAVGSGASDVLQTAIANQVGSSSGIIASVVSVVLLIVGATTLFTRLQRALNIIWGVDSEESSGGITEVIKTRALSFLMVLGIGMLLLAFLFISTAIETLFSFAPNPEGNVWLARGIDFAVSFVILTFLFALMYRFLPDAEVEWGDIWVGALVTAVLFTVGKSLIGLYLGRASISSVYGAAGSFVVLLVWVYFSAQIVLFGAEFTSVYTQQYGSQRASET